MILSNLKILGVVILISTFTFSIVQIHNFSFASNQNDSATSNLSNSTITNDELEKLVNSTSIGNMSQIINASLSDASYAVFNNASTPAVAIDPDTNSLYVVYFKNETGGANLYVQKSMNMGKTFTNRSE